MNNTDNKHKAWKNEHLIFELGGRGREAVFLSEEDEQFLDQEVSLPEHLARDPIEVFPEVSEPELVRHFSRTSRWNYGIDTGFYPLGSCTMKYNPKMNEQPAKSPGFCCAHPLQPEHLSQGALQLMHELERYLAEIVGMDRVTLQPAAGAHGELTGMLMIKAYFSHQNEQRSKILVPDTAHGTNPASVAMCGFKSVPVKSNKKGYLDKDTLASVMDEDVAAIMLTNPNTLGIFEEHIVDIADILHQKGGLVYCDGANLNALMGKLKLGGLGVDIVHLNLHKTFSAPHGGGGPGSGPVAVKDTISEFLPVPVVEKQDQEYFLDYQRPRSIGKVKSFYSNFLVCVKAYAYLLSMGSRGLKQAAETAVVNANYLRARLKEYFLLPYDRLCMHECVLSDKKQQEFGVNTFDIAKRLIDYGFHPPTIYFPLVVSGALMIEPTETESLQTLDRFIEAMECIAGEAEQNPDVLKQAPVHAKVRRVDEVKAARNPVLRWVPE